MDHRGAAILLGQVLFLPSHQPCTLPMDSKDQRKITLCFFLLQGFSFQVVHHTRAQHVNCHFETAFLSFLDYFCFSQFSTVALLNCDFSIGFLHQPTGRFFLHFAQNFWCVPTIKGISFLFTRVVPCLSLCLPATLPHNCYFTYLMHEVVKNRGSPTFLALRANFRK